MAKSHLVSGATIKYTGEHAKYSSEQRKGKPDGVKFGKRTGLSLTAYVDELLAANEKAKLGDGELQAELNTEFQGRPACQNISAYRGYFNASKHGHNPAGKYSSTCHGRNTGADAVKGRKDETHPNVLANRGPEYGQGKAKTAKGAKGAKGTKAAKSAKGAKGSKPAAKAGGKPAAAPKAKAAKKPAGKAAKPAAEPAAEQAAS